MKSEFHDEIINPSLDLHELHQSYSRNESVVIDAFLREAVALKIRQFLLDDKNADIWYQSIYPTLDPNEKHGRLHIAETSQKRLDESRQIANRAFDENTFSYCFQRTNTDIHSRDCDCMECQLKGMFLGDGFLSTIETITNSVITGVRGAFFAWYQPGDFITSHQDLCHRYASMDSIAFVLHFTQNWLETYGGLLYLLNNHTLAVEHTLIPAFNSMTLFRVKKNVGRRHYVSRVSNEVREPRLSFTGWFIADPLLLDL